MTETLLIIVVLLLILNFVGVIFILTKRKDTTDEKSLNLLLNQMNEVNRNIQDSQKNTAKTSTDQFERSQKLIQDINKQMTEQLLNVTKGVTEVSQSTKQVFTIAEQLSNLEKVLKHQKQRGNWGEAALELVLQNALDPTTYELQYAFKNGDTVDAIIKTKEGIIPIDAKFSLDNYSRLVNETDEVRKAELERDFKNDLKRRIDETAKYIKPSEGTLPFAFMFIPAEGIYYELLTGSVGSTTVNSRSLIDYSYNDKKVFIVSPTTFLAYLQSVLFGFKAFKIEESANKIRKYVGELQKHLKSYEDYHNKLGKNLGTVVNHYNSSSKEFKKIDKDIVRITDGQIELDPAQIEGSIAVDE
jgi:DNA recombination protein RmuC